MILTIQKCRTCGRVGVGDNSVRLHPLDGYLYCERGTPKTPGCYREALAWHETRADVILWLQMELAEPTHKRRFKPLEWRGFIHELCELAGIALEHHDKKSFVHYFARAMWAWDLKEIG